MIDIMQLPISAENRLFVTLLITQGTNQVLLLTVTFIFNWISLDVTPYVTFIRPVITSLYSPSKEPYLSYYNLLLYIGSAGTFTVCSFTAHDSLDPP